MTIRCIAVPALAIAIFGGVAAAPAAAQDFYKGKTLTILVGFSPGGGFDINARVLARHIGRHIPGNPNVVIQNMPGAGSLTAVHYMDLTAPKDGTVIDDFNFGTIGDSRLNPEKTKIDFRKFNWVGSISQDLTVCYAWHGLGVKTLADMKKLPRVHMGLTGLGTSSDTNQRILKNIFGVSVQHIAGYPGSAEQRIAVERGELDGDCGAWSSIPVIKSGPIFAPGMPRDVPYSVDIAPNEHDRQVIKLLLASAQVGRPFIASQAVPAERIRILRDAFNATMKDTQFTAELEKLRLPLSPKTGEEALQVVDEIYATPEDIVQAAKKIADE
jgi:tripartite-type tricarboxylate transporter receptor subunit TctC